MIFSLVIAAFLQVVSAPPDDPGYENFKNPSLSLVASFNLYLEDFRAAYYLPDDERKRVLDKINRDLPLLFFSQSSGTGLKHFSNRPFVFEMAELFEEHIDAFFLDDEDNALKKEMLESLWLSIDSYVDEGDDPIRQEASASLKNVRIGSFVLAAMTSVGAHFSWATSSMLYLSLKRLWKKKSLDRKAQKTLSLKKTTEELLRDPGKPASERLIETRKKRVQTCRVRLSELAEARRVLRGLEAKKKRKSSDINSSGNSESEVKGRSGLVKTGRLVGAHFLASLALGTFGYYYFDQDDRRDWDAQMDSLHQIIKPTVWSYLDY